MKATAGKAVQTRVVGERLAQLRRQFEQWRAGRQVGERIPSQLWDGAVSTVAEHSAYRVARELNLDYAVLKRRAAVPAGDVPATTVSAPRFVEMLAPVVQSMPAQPGQPECVVELANARGAKMPLELRGSGLGGCSTPACNAWR
jgi:hypothetical protein